jgi:glycosyltransferase involved in cell wall biosynthesis
MLEQLAARGHECHVVAPLMTAPEDLADRLAGHGEQPPVPDGDALVYHLRGVRVRAVRTPARLMREAVRQTRLIDPDRVLVSSDDPGALMLGAAFSAAPDRVGYLCHTLQQLPFGPRAFFPSPATTELVRRAAVRIAVSRAAQDYLRRWADLDSELVYPAVYGPGPHPDLSGGDSVTMVNPCGYKGIDIFLGLADAFPEVPFQAVRSWGSDKTDLDRLARRPNVTVTGPVDDMTCVYARARVLVVPSLWDETFGYTAVEALLHGVPVLAADIGGLPEAMLGVPHLLPVHPIETYRPESARPAPVVPPQPLGPWRDVLAGLLADPVRHRELSRRGRRAAAAFVAGLDPGALESCLVAVRQPVTS